jgi:hypothetical protein
MATTEDKNLAVDNWRAARCLELEAITRIDRGGWRHAERLVDELYLLRTRGDAEDFAPPRDLVLKTDIRHTQRLAGLEGINAAGPSAADGTSLAAI